MNPAERLLAIYDKLVSQQQDLSMTQTWAAVFNIEKTDPIIEDKVVSCVVALRKQIDFTRAKLTENGLPLDITNPGFPRLRDISSTGHLNVGWHGHRGNIQQPECRQAFMWASWVLRDSVENDISESDIQELLNEILEFEDSFSNIEMSYLLREFIQQQIESIRAALIISGVQGSRPIHEAVEKFAGAYTIRRKDIDTEVNKSSETTKNLFSKLGGLIKKTAEVGDAVDHLKSLAENVEAGYGIAKPFLLQIIS